MANPSRPAMIARLIGTAVVQTMVFAALLFIPAGTLIWWRAWVYLAVVFAGTISASIGILNVNEDLLIERLKPPVQKDQPVSDKVLLPAMDVAFIGLLVLIPIDVFRVHLLAKPISVLSSFGLVLFIAGWSLAYLGMRENAFAAPVVKYQSERKQEVVSTGPYRVMRHPMYAGGLLVFVGTPLWLESSAGALLAIVPVCLLVLRTIAEESFLRRELSGYAAYAKRVRYRLIPFVW